MSRRPVAFITGSRRGIGRAIARSLHEAGYDLALLDLQLSDELKDTAHELNKGACRAIAIAGDISDIQSHEHLLDQIESTLGPIDCLVNNAGVSVLSRGDLLDVSPSSYDQCLNINTRGTFFLTQAFAKRLVARNVINDSHHQSVITITSCNAVAGSPQRGEYCISKAALSMASTMFALRLAPLGIGVYEIRPGFIETEMTAPSKAKYDVQINQGITVMPRWGQPEEVAKIATTMATGGLPYTVGQAIHVDGGLLTPKY
jgi:NAD(P)-dependent dehydrogenase (short-subunit alcohol dehydrogenase family)